MDSRATVTSAPHLPTSASPPPPPPERDLAEYEYNAGAAARHPRFLPHQPLLLPEAPQPYLATDNAEAMLQHQVMAHKAAYKQLQKQLRLQRDSVQDQQRQIDELERGIQDVQRQLRDLDGDRPT